MHRWATRKAAQRVLTICEPRVCDVTYERPGGASSYARVVISAAPSRSFSFRSIAQWPTVDNYDDYVLDALLDELFATSVSSNYSGIAFELQEIGWDDVRSSATAFYLATRSAVREVLGGERGDNRNLKG
jgi:hypothetical protein